MKFNYISIGVYLADFKNTFRSNLDRIDRVRPRHATMMLKKISTVRSGELVNCWKYKTRYDNASAHHLTISKRTPPRVINAKNACMIKMA